ncbi:MAG TPA: HNH endonuclease signature motif containing protein, partial [Thermoplasmata archaeon]|nr:HNH endonuclease signature motif containing protein [Thermoplasmata archaeon]
QGRYFWDAARTYVIHRDRFTCQACGVRHRVRELDVDHILEIARGGPPLSYENLQTLCRPCHRVKTATFLRSRREGTLRGILTPSEGTESAGTGSDWFPA